MAAITPGVYCIQNVAASNVMELPGGSTAEVTNIVSNTKRTLSDTSLPFQLWVVSQVGTTDAYKIMNARSGSFMDLGNGSAADGTAIFGYHGYNGANQNWVIKHTTDGKAFVIQNQASKTFATLLKGGTADGTPIQGFAGAGVATTDPTQRWAFVRA